MNKLRQSLRRKKPAYVPEAARPHQWQADEEAVRCGKCSFPVRSGRKAVKSVLWVSADGLRVVDDKTKDLLVDQTIEKVSFCAPDRNFDKAFSYICRDGTTRRWICHCFLALKDSGERLSHAVGCAFAACLERKQRREKECGLAAAFDASRAPDKKPDETPLAETPVPAQPGNTSPVAAAAASPLDGGPGGGSQRAIPRRHAPLEQLVRQGSFRGFPSLSRQNSPFKRQLSLRLNELPSTLQRRDGDRAQGHGEAPDSPPPAPRDERWHQRSLQSDRRFLRLPPPAPRCRGPRGHPHPPRRGGPRRPSVVGGGGGPGAPPASPHPLGGRAVAGGGLQGGHGPAARRGGGPCPPPTPCPTRGPPRGSSCPPKSRGGSTPPPAVPVVGITPSQMVANIFCAAGPPLPPPKTNPPFPPPGLLATPPRPPGPPQTAPDPFEVQWAALGAKAPPPPPNPFAGDLQKTFEIEL
ncbi:numb-like protein isoform X2 [Mycteria americana]|uniref:numb-like protein isoform X2 n=1 Tax=Mycteria americana TaxID=33587 RepID=UPI003F5898D0